MNTANRPMYRWQDLPWKKIEWQVFKLQKRIYQASQRDDKQMIHRLQRLLIHSFSAKCLAVRRVTQDNRGKNTAGVDGIKALTPKQRLQLALSLTLSEKVLPTRRIWIPKPGKSEKRPLGIPTLRNRAQQALVLLTLEPEWEAKFEPNSYGFRPGRGCHDAIEAIFAAICHKAKYVLDADIAKCFDRINHRALLNKLGTFPFMRRVIQAWLKSGVMEGNQLFPTAEGTPQGGVASPLLANVALHGLETIVAESHPQARVIRYADDLVCIHEKLEVIEQVKQTVSSWLASIGLELKPDKTRITHTLIAYKGRVGFDFLGFNIRQYRVGKTHSGRTAGRELIGYKTRIKPSKEAMHRHSQLIKAVTKACISVPQTRLIETLNPIIIGWTAYYSTVESYDAFDKMCCLTFVKLCRWAKRRHTNKSWKWITRKYWRLEKGTWEFAPPDGIPLYRHFQTRKKRYIKVRGNKSPYDGDWVYWATRRSYQPGVPKRVATLLKGQAGKCASCGLYFRPDDKLEVDHILPRSQGGRDSYSNLQLLHAHCHHEKSAQQKQQQRCS
jgi:RNA-directed DNA polymerase